MSLTMGDAMARLMGELRHDPTEKRVRALLGDQVVVDSTRALLVWEPRRISPMYAVPAADVRAQLASSGPVTPGGPDFLHPGVPFAVHSTPGEALSVSLDGRTVPDAAFRAADRDLDGYVLLDFGAFEWLEEDEPIRAHPRNPYHAVDIRASSRHVRIEDCGRLLAESKRPTLVFETGLPVRFYLPREDVVAELRPSEQISYCPYKGQASYWSVGGRDNIAWSYESPLADATQLGGLIAFWDDVLAVTVDGVARGQADTASAEALRKEFDVEA